MLEEDTNLVTAKLDITKQQRLQVLRAVENAEQHLHGRLRLKTEVRKREVLKGWGDRQ